MWQRVEDSCYKSCLEPWLECGDEDRMMRDVQHNLELRISRFKTAYQLLLSALIFLIVETTVAAANDVTFVFVKYGTSQSKW